MSFVYVIAAGEFVKIGITSNVRKRIAALQTASPVRLELVCVLVPKNGHTAREIETQLHELLADDVAEGGKEWFKTKDAVPIADLLSILGGVDDSYIVDKRSCAINYRRQT